MQSINQSINQSITRLIDQIAVVMTVAVGCPLLTWEYAECNGGKVLDHPPSNIVNRSPDGRCLSIIQTR